MKITAKVIVAVELEKTFEVESSEEMDAKVDDYLINFSLKSIDPDDIKDCYIDYMEYETPEET